MPVMDFFLVNVFPVFLTEGIRMYHWKKYCFPSFSSRACPLRTNPDY